MPSAKRPPSYRFHKARNCAVVTINGKNQYLGPYGSPESYEKYARVLAGGQAAATTLPPAAQQRGGTDVSQELSVNGLLVAYWQFAKDYYSKGGKPTKELTCMREVIEPLRQLFGISRASAFGPKNLKTVRQHMIDGGLSRGVVNHRIGRIKRIFRWAVGEELVPASVHHGLVAVTGLRYGRTEARETDPIKPVPWESVEPVLPCVSPQVAAMIQLQWLTGMRPCEVVAMQLCDVDRSGDIWIYELSDHKNRWRGHERKIPLGPKAQEIIRPFLDRPPTAFLFSPQEAEQWRHAQQRQQRQTPMTPSQSKRKSKAKPRRAKRDHYDTATYQGAIEHGIAKANKARQETEQIPHWFPLQIRHSRGTEVRRRYGLDAAQAALGHARADVTEVYAEKNMELAMKIAREMG